MGVSDGRTKVIDTAFQVFARTIHPDWFATRRHRRIARPAWEADIRVIDGGHVISWAAGPVRLTEVLCGPETLLPESGLLLQGSASRERSATLRRGGAVEYQTCYDSEQLDPQVFRHLCDELTLDAGKGLFHRFAPANRIAPPPLGFIRVDARPGGLSIQTFRTFPDDRSIVRTQSLFELLGGERN